MNVKIGQVYKACMNHCNSITELQNLLETIDNGKVFYPVIKDYVVDSNGVIKYSNYQIIKMTCNIILGKPINVLQEPYFDFGKQKKQVYSEEMNATVRYVKSNGFPMIEFYKNLKYSENELAGILNDLKDTISVFPYSHNYEDIIGICLMHYFKSNLGES